MPRVTASARYQQNILCECPLVTAARKLRSKALPLRSRRGKAAETGNSRTFCASGDSECLLVTTARPVGRRGSCEAPGPDAVTDGSGAHGPNPAPAPGSPPVTTSAIELESPPRANLKCSRAAQFQVARKKHKQHGSPVLRNFFRVVDSEQSRLGLGSSLRLQEDHDSVTVPKYSEYYLRDLLAAARRPVAPAPRRPQAAQWQLGV